MSYNKVQLVSKKKICKNNIIFKLLQEIFKKEQGQEKRKIQTIRA